MKLDEDQAKYKKASVYPLPEVEEMELPVTTKNGEQGFFIFHILYDGALPPYFESTKEDFHDAYYTQLRARYGKGFDMSKISNRELLVARKVVIFIKHHFSDLGIRDLDNRNRKLLIDALRANGVIGDDNWKSCAIYEEGVLAEQNAVEIFVMKREAFPHFLQKNTQ